MAEEPKGSTPTQDALLVMGAFAILVLLWYFAGGPGKADLRGLFLSPPPPVGTGDAYGPTFGDEQSTSTEQLEPPPPLQGY